MESAGMPMNRKNVVVFITDGHRAEALGCYGNELLQTPNLDAFAGEGVLFERAFCTHSVCMPNRASIFTGRYPHVHGVWANGVALPRTETTLPQVLAEDGYATCAAGKVHFEPQQAYADGLAPIISTAEPYYGFDEVHLSENCIGKEYLRFVAEEFPELSDRARKRDRMPEEAHDLQWITDQAINFIERQASGGGPFFCSCSFHELCPPCTPPETFAGMYDPADVPVPELRESDLEKRPPFYRECYEGYLKRGRHPDEPTLRKYIASYYDQTSFIDRQFGRLVAALQRLGVSDDTVVLFTADHGLALNDHYQWRHGPFLFDQVTNVPMIWRAPGLGGQGVVTDELVEGVDIMPTVLDICGVEAPPGVQGRSLAPLLRGDEGARGRESVLMQERQAPDLAARGLDPETITQVGVRTRDWKLIHYVDYPPSLKLRGTSPHGELYDLSNDPGEFNNLWADPGHRQQRAEMESLLMDRLAAAQDPLPVRHYDW
jgi:arylsulfatase